MAFLEREIMEYSVQSFQLDVRRLDDRPPFLDFGLVEGGEALRRLLLARSYV